MREAILAELARIYPDGYRCFATRSGKRLDAPDIIPAKAGGRFIANINGERHLFGPDGSFIGTGDANKRNPRPAATAG